MKFKFLMSFLIAGAAVASAQGYIDGVEYFRADQPEEAEIILVRTLNDAGTNRATAFYYLGEIALSNKNAANAKNFFEQGIAADANNAFNYVGLGQIALGQDNKAAADDFFKQAVKINKKNALILTEIARSFYNADPVKYAKDIEKYIKDAKKADKNCPATFILEADMLAPTNVGEAAGYYEMAMNADTKNEHPEAYVKYARTYFRVNPSFSIEGLKKLLDIQPESALAQRELAEKYYDNGQYGRAAEQYGKYIQNPNHFKRDEQRYSGLLYFSKKYQESYDLAGKILAEDPDNFYMKRMRFLNQAALGNTEQALADADVFFSAQGEFTPNDYTTYGELLHNEGQDSLAVVQYQKAVELSPDRSELHLQLSDAYTDAKMYVPALLAFQKFMEGGDYATNDLMVLSRRFQNAAAAVADNVEERNNYLRQAIATVERVEELVPDNALVAVSHARLVYALNDRKITPEVAEDFNKALGVLDKDPENVSKRKSDYVFLLGTLAMGYITDKDYDSARPILARFIEIDPTNESINQVYEQINK